jgi:hypothetical protein
MKINQPGLLSGAMGGSVSGSSRATTPGSDTNDKRPVETIRSVISSIYSSALNTEQTELGLRNGSVAASGAFAMYYASLLLISHGAGVLQDAEWLQKVEAFKSTLARFAMRWKIAGEFVSHPGSELRMLTGDTEKYVDSIHIALGSRLGGPMQI